MTCLSEGRRKGIMFGLLREGKISPQRYRQALARVTPYDRERELEQLRLRVGYDPKLKDGSVAQQPPNRR